jgi:hypothetical protein
VTFYPLPQQGWQCPMCKRVHAPFVMTCPYCPLKINTVTLTNTRFDDGPILSSPDDFS